MIQVLKKLNSVRRSWRRRHDQLGERGKRAHQVNLVEAFVVELKRSGVGNVLVDLSYSTRFAINMSIDERGGCLIYCINTFLHLWGHYDIMYLGQVLL